MSGLWAHCQIWWPSFTRLKSAIAIGAAIIAPIFTSRFESVWVAAPVSWGFLCLLCFSAFDSDRSLTNIYGHIRPWGQAQRLGSARRHIRYLNGNWLSHRSIARWVRRF